MTDAAAPSYAGPGKFQAQLPVLTPTTWMFPFASPWQTRKIRLADGIFTVGKVEGKVSLAPPSWRTRSMLVGGGSAEAAPQAANKEFAVEVTGTFLDDGSRGTVVFACSTGQESRARVPLRRSPLSPPTRFS